MTAQAIVVAAGRSLRMGAPPSKLLRLLGGLPVLVRTVLAVKACPAVTTIVVVVPPGQECAFESVLAAHGLAGIAAIVPGGNTRQESVRAGFEALVRKPDVILVHDGARPLVASSAIEEVILGAERHGAAILAVPISDTLKRVCAQTVVETVDRRDLWAAQTPQAFRYELLAEALGTALEKTWDCSDESALFERLGWPVHVTPGSVTNLKLTTPEDFLTAEAILAQQTI